MRATESDAVDCLHHIFRAAVDTVLPAQAVLRHLPQKPKGRCVVVGAGKASAAMAAAVDSAWPDVDLSGVITTRYEHAVDAGRIAVIEAGHPVPDHASEEGARRVIEAVQGLDRDDLVIALISGGGSATLAQPVDCLSLSDKQSLTKELLASGASIEEINTVRQQLSKIKGGGLSAAVGNTRLVTLLISDIPGDTASAIASGPTFPSTASGADALTILNRYDITIAAPVRAYLSEKKPQSLSYPYHEYRIIANPASALITAAEEAKKLGFNPLILSDAIEGESTELGKIMARIAISAQSMGHPVKTPAAIISGGETTVTIGKEGAGRGGRNTEFALSMAFTLDGAAGIYCLACDSDGIDGTEDAAGAFITPKTLHQATKLGLDTRDFLKKHDSYSFFNTVHSLVRTGPTLTNVNDIRVVLVFS